MFDNVLIYLWEHWLGLEYQFAPGWNAKMFMWGTNIKNILSIE